MTDSNTPGFEQLLDWIEGRLPEQEARQIEEQVATGDNSLRATVDWLRAFLQNSSQTVLASPSPEVREVLMRRFEAFAEKRQPTLFQRLMATLTFDSGAQATAAGLRTSGIVEQPQLLFSTDVADIAINIQRHPHDTYNDLHGQIFLRDDTPGIVSVQLLRNGEEIGLVLADELGEFTFADIASGEYELILTTDQFEVSITPLQLQS